MGMEMAVSKAMMEMTINSSANVKPVFFFMLSL